MKRILTVVGVMLMIALGCISCKDKSPNYPESIASGTWAGGSASTGYTCDVVFAAENMPGSHVCTITLTDPAEDETATFQGPFVYSADTGMIHVKLGGADGAPSAATLRFNFDADAMEVSFTSLQNFGTYVVYAVPFPQTLAGYWIDEKPGMIVDLYMSPKAINGGLPCYVGMNNGHTTEIYNGFYTYNATTGKGTLTVSKPGVAEQSGTIAFHAADNTVSMVISGLSIDVKMKRDRVR